MLFYSFVRPLLFSWCLVLLLRIKWNESYRREQIKMCIFHLNQLFSGSIFVIFFVYDSDFYCKHNWHSGCRLQYHYNWITHTRFMVKCHLFNGNEFIDSIITFLAKKKNLFLSLNRQTIAFIGLNVIVLFSHPEIQKNENPTKENQSNSLKFAC